MRKCKKPRLNKQSGFNLFLHFFEHKIVESFTRKTLSLCRGMFYRFCPDLV